MPDSDWHLILSEEVGEVAQAILEGTRLEMEDLIKIEGEIVQVAAVAVAWLEDLEQFKAQLEAWERDGTCA